MAITNGSAITKADLDAMITAALALIQADNGQVPQGLEVHLYFPNLVAATTALLAKAVIVAPYDCYVETIAAEGGEHTAASTLTVTVTGDGALGAWPKAPAAGSTTPFAKASGAVGAGINKIARLLFDGTKSAPSAGADTSRSVRIIPRGTTLTVAVTTTSVATPSMTHVVLVLREHFAREGT